METVLHSTKYAEDPLVSHTYQTPVNPTSQAASEQISATKAFGVDVAEQVVSLIGAKCRACCYAVNS
jgi:hypothetical protein